MESVMKFVFDYLLFVAGLFVITTMAVTLIFVFVKLLERIF